jgi:hypothetical protein
MYFKEKQVSISFQRLSARKRSEAKSKTHLERTSVLMCFLAFDAVCKISGSRKLDLDPSTFDGKKNRTLIALEFSKLVLLDGSNNKHLQVMELGKISGSEKNPEVRFSSNFLTVPLKKASEQTSECHYPKRPRSTRILKLGTVSTGLKWGISYDDDWRTSVPKLLSEVKESTPLTDLAIFIMRNTKQKGENYIDALEESLQSRFTQHLSEFWIERIIREKLLAKHILDNPFCSLHEPFNQGSRATEGSRFDKVSRDLLISHIDTLEQILTANQIDFPVVK